MNNIKFKAWDKNQKKMFQVERIDFDFDTGDKVQTVHLVPNELNDERGWDEHPEVNIQDVDLLQYTGLKDRNGTEIYNGNIVKATHLKFEDWNTEKLKQEDKLFRIDYIQGAFLFGRINGDRTILLHGIFMDKDYYKARTENTPFYKLDDGTYEQYTDFEVIGTIQENPELLGGII
jgi:uncharacterized phage protein (TIGR01671 family)